MAGTTWNDLVPGTRAKATDVEQNFDWLEQDLVPMIDGTKTDATYDLGTSSFRWRDGWFSRRIYIGTGTSGSPSVAGSNDQDTGIVFLGGNVLAAAAGGVEAWRINSAGQTLLANGTASTPSLAFTNDQTTGMYRPATGTVAFVSRGSESLRIDSVGRITQPQNPAFTAYWNETTTALSIGSVNSLIDGGVGNKWTEAFDRGDNFSGGVFYAPVEGLYEFHVKFTEERTGSFSSCWVALVTSARVYGAKMGTHDGGSEVGNLTHAFSVIADMSAGATAYVYVFVSGNGTGFNVVGFENSGNTLGALTTFSGSLVG